MSCLKLWHLRLEMKGQLGNDWHCRISTCVERKEIRKMEFSQARINFNQQYFNKAVLDKSLCTCSIVLSFRLYSITSIASSLTFCSDSTSAGFSRYFVIYLFEKKKPPSFIIYTKDKRTIRLFHGCSHLRAKYSRWTIHY